MIHVPGQELKAVALRLQVDVVILGVSEKAVEVAQEGIHGQKAEKLIDIQVVFQLGCKVFIGGLAHQTCKGDDPFFLSLGQGGLGHETNLVRFP